MAGVGKKGPSPEETAAMVSATAIARGKDQAQSAIVGILGRGKPFTRVHIGLTDVDLGKSTQDRGGYAVTAISLTGSAHTVAAVAKVIGDWLLACHGKKYEATVANPVVKVGTKTLYLAVA